MELPVNFKNEMNELLGGEYDELIAAFDEKPAASLRINTSKISEEEFEKRAPFPLEKVPFVSGAYYINDTDEWSKHPYYFAGLYYIQEASAMLPASFLPVRDDDIICDLCAAPGGKSTQLAAGAALLVSNDISRSRAIPLVRNLEMTGCDDFLVTVGRTSSLSGIYSECFDSVLADAPCSGEGMFRRSPHLIKDYEQKGPGYYAPVQREILEDAYKLTKSGGMIMYSTCTFSDIENEQVILSFLNDHSDMRVEDISGAYEGFRGPYEKYADEYRLKGCVHVFPHKMRGEGHFLALMKKAGEGGRKHLRPKKECGIRYEKLPDAVLDVFKLFGGTIRQRLKDGEYLINDDGLVTLLPVEGAGYYDRRLHYARTGTCMGYLRRSGTFVPHTALALMLSYDDISNRISFEACDENVYRYLKGETILPSSSQRPDKGYAVVTVGRYPLGFAKFDGTRLKNLYEKGWIYR